MKIFLCEGKISFLCQNKMLFLRKKKAFSCLEQEDDFLLARDRDRSGCKIRRVDEKMKCSQTCQNELKTCQNECEYYSEAEFDSEMLSKPCFIMFLMILGLIFCISTLLSDKKDHHHPTAT